MNTENEWCQKAVHEARYAALLEMRALLDKELESNVVLRRVRDQIDAACWTETQSEFYRPGPKATE